MADVVLDTHACVYALIAPARLGKAARRAMAGAEAGRLVAWVPAAVAAEIVLLRELGRIKVGLPELRTAMDASSCLRFLALDLRQLDDFAAHRGIADPFDRLIVSACRAVDARLVSRDTALAQSGLVRVVWD
ncbi:MAG TPA: PIN domain-containing protein [Vicinamibacterales bacterium]|nr:PIN domain-containing protein [Vicinamibacterales bacterium]